VSPSVVVQQGMTRRASRTGGLISQHHNGLTSSPFTPLWPTTSDVITVCVCVCVCVGRMKICGNNDESGKPPTSQLAKQPISPPPAQSNTSRFSGTIIIARHAVRDLQGLLHEQSLPRRMNRFALQRAQKEKKLPVSDPRCGL
jgi:hypothetical protein